MRYAPPELVATLNATLDAEREARGALREALERQAEAARALRRAGVQTTTVARYMAACLGLPATPSVRQRLPARLRKRLSRVTRCHVFRPGRAVAAPSVRVPSKEKEMPEMARLITRTTTETFEGEEGEECAHLALSSAVEHAVRRTFRKASAEREAVTVIAKSRRSPDLPEKVERLQARLHRKCFHLGRCGSPLAVGQAIGEASGLVDEILRYRPRQKPRPRE